MRHRDTHLCLRAISTSICPTILAVLSFSLGCGGVISPNIGDHDSGTTDTFSGGSATGGTTSAGGRTGTGGTTSAGGSVVAGSGGIRGAAGATANRTGGNGVGASGGRTASGGAATTGGNGVAVSGGRTATGGATAAGGTPGAAGASAASSALIGWASVAGLGVSTTTGGGNTAPVIATSISALNSNVSGTSQRVIQVSGTLSGTVSVGSNKTIVGLPGAQIRGSIELFGSVNVIIRNLKVVGSPNDAANDTVSVSDMAHHLWFDHLDVSDGGDGNLDIKHGSDFITVSWTKFSYSGDTDHQFANLIGHDNANSSEDAGHLKVTFHHDWWADNVQERMPRVRFGQVHVFNSLYTASGNVDGIHAGVSANIRVENNVFQNIDTVFQFSDSNAAAVAESIGNSFSNCTGTTGRGTSFRPPYPYSLDTTSLVEASVRAGVGPH